jgi:hypothetical protein
LSVFNQQGAVNVIIDVTGYFIGGEVVPTTTTTVPGATTTTTSTTVAPAGPALKTDAATYVATTGTIGVTGTGWTGCTAITFEVHGPGSVVTVVPLVTVNPALDGSFTTSFVAPAANVGTGVTVHGSGTGTGCTADSAAFAITA